MSTPAFSTPPDRYAEDLLRLTRRDLDIGMTWWVDANNVTLPAYDYVISTLKAEGYPTDSFPLEDGRKWFEVRPKQNP